MDSTWLKTITLDPASYQKYDKTRPTADASRHKVRALPSSTVVVVVDIDVRPVVDLQFSNAALVATISVPASGVALDAIERAFIASLRCDRR